MNKFLLTLGAGLILTSGYAQNPGELDVTFGIGGVAVTDPYALTGEHYWNLNTVADDKIVKVGFADDGNNKNILVARFKADGTPDSTFATNGFLNVDLSLGGAEEARGFYELPSGKLLVTGYVQVPGGYDGFIMQVNADGTIDDMFGSESGHTKFNAGDNTIGVGKDVVEYGNEIFVGGSVLNGGQGDIAVFNFTAGGLADLSFSSGGAGLLDIDGELDEVYSMSVTTGGAFIFAGISDSSNVRRGFVASLSQFGTPTSFAGTGAYTFDMGSGMNEVNDVIVDANGKIVFVGDEGIYPNVNGFVKRLNSDGSIDNSFGSSGTQGSDPGATTALFFRGVVETSQGYVCVGNFDGASKDLYAMYLEPDGGLNGNYGGNGDVIVSLGIVTNTIAAMGGAVQSNGAIIIGGFLTSQDFVGSNMFMVRLLPFDDASVSELTLETITVYPNPASNQFSVQMDGVNRVEMISMNGAVVGFWEAQSSYSIPAGTAPGLYLIKVEGENSKGIARIVVE